jgi:hypothetical protein
MNIKEIHRAFEIIDQIAEQNGNVFIANKRVSEELGITEQEADRILIQWMNKRWKKELYVQEDHGDFKTWVHVANRGKFKIASLCYSPCNHHGNCSIENRINTLGRKLKVVVPIIECPNFEV